jgi:hypothetical protein
MNSLKKYQQLTFYLFYYYIPPYLKHKLQQISFNTYLIEEMKNEKNGSKIKEYDSKSFKYKNNQNEIDIPIKKRFGIFEAVSFLIKK